MCIRDSYENLRGLTDYKLACQYVVEDGYCSDPGYAENLIGLIEDYELYRYDVGDVDPGEVTRVALSESNITLRVGQSFSLEASVYPATATDKSVTWSSSDTSVATCLLYTSPPEIPFSISLVNSGTALVVPDLFRNSHKHRVVYVSAFSQHLLFFAKSSDKDH